MLPINTFSLINILFAGPGDRHSEGNVTGVRRGSILRSLIENTEMMESTIELVEDDTFRQVSVDEILHLAKEAKCQFMEMKWVNLFLILLRIS